MSAAPSWPGGARGALSLTFDNFIANGVLPSLLERLAARDLAVTFFVEGLNAELHPDELATIDAGGHEIGYHAWRHEEWGGLTAGEQAENLARGIDGFRRIGLEARGLRPPGGALGPGGLDVLRQAGLRYCSPAGEGAGEDGGLALLPFQWRHVDAGCVLPGLEAARLSMTGSEEPVDPDTFLASLERQIAETAGSGGYMAIVLHLAMLDWLGEDRLGALLDRVARTSQQGGLWVAPCADAAEHVLAHREAFRRATTLDSTSWTDAKG